VNAAAVRLVARREIVERSRMRSFRVALFISLLAVVVSVALPKILAKPTRPVRLGVVGDATLPLAPLENGIGRAITVSHPASAAAAQAAVNAKHLDVAVAGDAVITRTAPKPSDTGATSRLALELATVIGVESSYKAAGLTPSQITALATAKPAPVTALRPAGKDRTRQRVTTLVGIVLLWISIQTFGQWIAGGVVEEKASRVVEVLLATVRTTELLTGKIIGIGTLAIGQVVLLATAAFVASEASGSHVISGASSATVVAMVGWFLLGYGYYACLFAAGGSLVSRVEEIGNVQFPVILPLIVAYVSSFGSIFGTPSPFTVVLSFIPPTAPIAMPVRVAATGVPWWQLGVCVALMLAAIVAAVGVGARVYDRAILRTSKVSWRDAFRASAG